MNNERLMHAIGDIDPELVVRAKNAQVSNRRKRIIAAVIIAALLCMTCVAVIAEWDFFRASYREQEGFVYPDLQWGMTPEQVQEATGYSLIQISDSMYRLPQGQVSFWGHTPEVYYQFFENELISVSLSFNTRGNRQELAALKDKLLDTMEKTYDRPEIKEETITISEGKLGEMQAALRRYLNIEEKLDALGNDENITEQEAPAPGERKIVQYYWTKDNTVICLTVSYENGNEVRSLGLSFARKTGQGLQEQNSEGSR